MLVAVSVVFCLGAAKALFSSAHWCFSGIEAVLVAAFCALFSYMLGWGGCSLLGLDVGRH
jgi:VIT1/CCC1 family predicted Fe2+/Mn2+ transporter